MFSAITATRAGGGPSFLEFRTYRFRAHSMFDPDLYRDPTEVEQWKERDPIHVYATTLIDRGEITDDDLTKLWNEATAEIDDAVAYAEASDWESPDTLLDHVYAMDQSGDPPAASHDDDADDWAGSGSSLTASTEVNR